MKKAEGKQHRSGLVLGLLWSVGWMSGVGPASAQARVRAESERPLNISVWVYNYAQGSRKDLAEAERESGAILAKAGIQISWLHCPAPACEQPPSPTSLTVIVLPQSMTELLQTGADVFGFAIASTDGRPSVRTEIFYDRVRALTRQFGYSPGLTLGSVMAHELGHLLLETGGHASIGIMRARWSREDLLAAACGWLLFTPQQAERMRSGIRRRAQLQAVEGVATATAAK
jgi:hypothetical protein